MNLSYLTNEELLRHENEPGFQTEAAKRFSDIARNTDAAEALEANNIDADQTFEDLKDEIEFLQQCKEALQDLIEAKATEEIERHKEYYCSEAYLDDLWESLASIFVLERDRLIQQLDDIDLPQVVVDDVMEGVLIGKINVSWEVVEGPHAPRFSDVIIAEFDRIGDMYAPLSDALQTALQTIGFQTDRFDSNPVEHVLTNNEELLIDLSDHWPYLLATEDDIKNYLKEIYGDEKYHRLCGQRVA